MSIQQPLPDLSNPATSGYGLVSPSSLTPAAQRAFGERFAEFIKACIRLIEDATTGKSKLVQGGLLSPVGLGAETIKLGDSLTARLRGLGKGFADDLEAARTRALDAGRLFKPLILRESFDSGADADEAERGGIVALDHALRLAAIRADLRAMDATAAALLIRSRCAERDRLVAYAVETQPAYEHQRLLAAGLNWPVERSMFRARTRPAEFALLDVVTEVGFQVQASLGRTREQVRAALVGTGGRLPDESGLEVDALQVRFDALSGALDGLRQADVDRLRRAADVTVEHGPQLSAAASA